MAEKPRVAHFVTGGGSGATQVAVDVAVGQARSGRVRPILILRSKRRQDPGRWIRRAEEAGIPAHLVSSTSKVQTILQLHRIFRDEQTDIAVCHGYSEHLWGRLAALWAGVPVLIQVEHSLERYSWLRLRLSLWLAKRTQRIITVSGGVREALVGKGHPAGLIRVIYNSIDFERYSGARQAWEDRSEELVMVARWARQKDQETLIRALGILRDRGRDGLRLHLVGGGRERHRKKALGLIDSLGLRDRVSLCGRRDDIPQFLGSHRHFILSTHFEGFPLVLMEAMAAGCCVVATRAPGVDEMIRHGENGFLTEPRNPDSMADVLVQVLDHPEAARKAAELGHESVRDTYSMEAMIGRYDAELLELFSNSR